MELTVDAKDAYTDCFKATCVLATRADHTLSGDRSQGVKVPVSFTGQAPVDTDENPTDPGDTTGGTTGGSTGGTGTTTTGGTDTTTTTTTTAGGSLAATGATIGTAAGTALLLTATGWYLRRRARAAADS